VIQAPIEELLPHRGTMLLLDCVLDFSAERICAQYAPRRGAWYADARGNMPAWIGIELMAQAIAAHVGLLKRSEGKAVVPGILLGTRRFEAQCPAFAAGAILRICATVSFRDESGLAAYECEIEADDAALASASLKVLEPADFQSLLGAAAS
jgi:predicted hotdog family 3-hydroxylacyl-ACP dehydratase